MFTQDDALNQQACCVFNAFMNRLFTWEPYVGYLKLTGDVALKANEDKSEYFIF